MTPKLAVYEGLLPANTGNKAKRTYLQIIEAALKAYSKYGFDNATFERIAKEADVTRPLILRYFKNYDGLFQAAIKYVRIGLQEFVIERMMKHEESVNQFATYTKAVTEWLSEYPMHAELWLFFYYQCSRQNEYRKLNSELVRMGEKRICEFVSELNPKLSDSEKLEKAKLLQLLITGLSVALLTEDLTPTLREVKNRLPDWLTELARS